MPVEIRELTGKEELREFIFLPEKIHKNHKNWVHPLYMDEWVFFDPKRNRSFRDCDTTIALAWNGSKPAGRIMGIINNKYNKIHGESNARFCFMECYEDFEVAAALIKYAEEWAISRGMNKLVGPLGFSDKDPQGFIIEGFDEEVLIATNFNYPWMQDFIERLGYEKEIDLVGYKIEIPDRIPEYIERVYNRVITNNGYRVHEFSSRKSVKPWIIPVFRLINEAYSHIYGFVELDEREMEELADRYLPVLNPHFIKLITNTEDEVIAFVISMPELGRGIRNARGRILPFGWFHILRESRKTRLLTMLLGAIKESYRGKGLDSILGMKLLQSAKKRGMIHMDSHLILETNSRMRAEYERMGGRVHKRYRIFYRNL